jgi:hypothetical protein
MTIQFTKATRRAVRLKVGVDGPSGSGKTLGALALAHGITNGGRIAVADSENGSAALYADRFAFDTVTLAEPRPDTYRAVIDAAASAGYDALVIDSLSHAWLATLGDKEDHDRSNPKSNQWTNWRLFGPKWDALMQHILQAPLHIVATMRSKQAYEQVDSGGKKQVVKLGLQPQVRNGAEYEFGIVFSVNQAHRAEASKDRTGLFADRMLDLCDPNLHAELSRWMNLGGPEVPQAARPSAPDQSASVAVEAASQDDLNRIIALLDKADVNDETRHKTAQATARGLTKKRAGEIIAGLEKLVPAPASANGASE